MMYYRIVNMVIKHVLYGLCMTVFCFVMMYDRIVNVIIKHVLYKLCVLLAE